MLEHHLKNNNVLLGYLLNAMHHYDLNQSERITLNFPAKIGPLNHFTYMLLKLEILRINVLLSHKVTLLLIA